MLKEKVKKKKKQRNNFKQTNKQTNKFIPFFFIVLVIFPIQMGPITIHSLGTISQKAGFHNDKYIWPVGWKR